MEQRFAVRKREMLAEAVLQPSVTRGMLDRLEAFAEPFAGAFRRRAQKGHARTYLRGLVSDLGRKNVESIAYRHDQSRKGLQHFIGESPWDHRALLAELGRQVGAELGEADGVIVFDPSSFKKCGADSVGVARQWLGRYGKVDNGQVGLYMGYAARQAHALVDARLYLPREWTRDRTRCRKAGIPRAVRFQTRHEMALSMLRERGAVLPHAWIAGDDEMGRVTWFRRALRDMSECYLLAVPSHTLVRDLEGRRPAYRGHGPRPKRKFERVDRLASRWQEPAWTTVDVRDGEKGPLTVEISTRRVVARLEHSRLQSTEELLVVMRSPDEGGGTRTDYYLSNAAADTPRAELARVAKAEHRIEECIKRAKSEAGLADYEVRNWPGWHHHQTLALIATWFLVQEARRGKKVDPGHHGAHHPQPVVGSVA